jgi:aminopeptidase
LRNFLITPFNRLIMIQIDDYSKLNGFKTVDSKSLKEMLLLYKIKKDTNVLILTDNKKGSAAPRIAKTIYDELGIIGANTSLIVGRPTTKLGLAPKKINEAIFSLSEGDVLAIIASTGKGYTHKKGKRVMIKDLIKKQGFRMLSMSALSSMKPNKVNTFLKSLNHDQKEVEKLNKKIARAMEKTTEVRITCSKGTDLTLSIKDRPVIMNHANWKEYSTNYPVGETYTTPIEDSCEGKAVVSSYKVTGKTILPKKPVEMIFEEGLLVETTGKEMAHNVNMTIRANKKFGTNNYEDTPRTISEFAIGTNKKASIVGAMICDEKTYGTCHIAIGSNKHFGGKNYCLGHFDNVIVKPTIYFDDKMIMEKGKLLL